MPRICVAGAGHGGLACAIELAQSGYDVTVLERDRLDQLGYDWTDIFDTGCLREIGITSIPEEMPHCKAEHMTFCSPKGVEIKAEVPEDQRETQMERRDIYRLLLKRAKETGVQFQEQCQVLGSIIRGQDVSGLRVLQDGQEREELCDLVIDAAGVRSPVRLGLPAALGIPGPFQKTQCFKVYRAFYEKKPDASENGPFRVHFFPLGMQAIAWVADEGNYYDFLCGCFEPMTPALAEQMRTEIRKQYPLMGDKILRGGQLTEIPVRRPLGLFVANGYAAVGDSAAMTIPLIGSGIYNAVMAGKLLADTVKNSPDYRAEHLWNYQVRYMTTIGAEHTAVDLLKNYILGMKAADVDFLFEKQVINQKDLVTIRTGHSLRLGLGDMAQKGVRGASKIPLLLQILSVLNQGNKIQKHCRRIPQTYQEEAVRRWAGMYEQDFT